MASGAIFLLSLPFTHTVALRLISLFTIATFVFLTWKTREHPPLLLIKPLLAWAGLALLSLTWAIDPVYSLHEIKNEIGYSMVAFFSFYSLTQNQRDWRFWNRVLLFGFLAVSISGVFAYWIAPSLWQKGGVHGGVGDYSTYLITVFPFVLYWTLQSTGSKLARVLAVLLVPIVLLGGFLTMNRAFWPTWAAVLIVFVALFSFKNYSPQRARLVVVGALVFSLFAMALFMETVAQKAPLSGTRSEILVATVEKDPRLLIWSFAATQIMRHPLTGSGFGRGTMREAFAEHFQNDSYWHAHNLIIDYALQLGLGGIIVLFLVFGAVAREFWILYRSGDPEANLVGVIGMALLTGTLIKNMTDDFFFRQHSLLFWALVGICLGYGKRRLVAIGVFENRAMHK